MTNYPALPPVAALAAAVRYARLMARGMAPAAAAKVVSATPAVVKVAAHAYDNASDDATPAAAWYAAADVLAAAVADLS